MLTALVSEGSRLPVLAGVVARGGRLFYGSCSWECLGPAGFPSVPVPNTLGVDHEKACSRSARWCMRCCICLVPVRPLLKLCSTAARRGRALCGRRNYSLLGRAINDSVDVEKCPASRRLPGPLYIWLHDKTIIFVSSEGAKGGAIYFGDIDGNCCIPEQV